MYARIEAACFLYHPLGLKGLYASRTIRDTLNIRTGQYLPRQLIFFGTMVPSVCGCERVGMSKILIVDDDEELAKGLKAFFTLQGYVIELCGTGEDALQLLANFNFDIIVLDWGLPQLDGKEVCRTYRSNGGQTPIIFLTGKEDVAYLEEGLASGADDYLSKPFDVRELSARVKSLLKRRTGVFVPELKIGNLVLKPDKGIIVKETNVVQLRAKEASLLEYLMRYPNQIFSAQQLLDAVWPSDGEGTTNSVRTWMNLLRRKLAVVGEENLIRTVLGSGYIIDADIEKT